MTRGRCKTGDRYRGRRGDRYNKECLKRRSVKSKKRQGVYLGRSVKRCESAKWVS